MKIAMLTVRNLPDEVHRALHVRAARHGHRMKAEMREILESAVSPEGRVKLASLLADMGRRATISVRRTLDSEHSDAWLLAHATVEGGG